MRTVRKGWVRWEANSKPIRVLIDDYGYVFGRYLGGWMRPPEQALLKVLPGIYLFPKWALRDWWEKRLWRDPTWAWIHSDGDRMNERDRRRLAEKARRKRRATCTRPQRSPLPDRSPANS